MIAFTACGSESTAPMIAWMSFGFFTTAWTAALTVCGSEATASTIA